MTDERERCIHQKVYENKIFCTNPPQQRWICRICRAEGIEILGKPTTDEYSEIKFKLNHK